ncbi:MAG: PAS domain S-box protein [Xanthomonadaceae bacterium]|nr:PAS domain S-box protein [Xanthomonadaceae bacterium]
MLSPRLPDNETERLALLRALDLLDRPPDPAIDRITRTAARLFVVPVALVTLVDADRQWFLSRVGLDRPETPREHSMCGHAILEREAMVVCDALSDVRFHDNPLVTGAPHIRFYAGRPLRSRQGLVLGTLCLIDRVPREFGESDRAALDDLADMVQAILHAREDAQETDRVRANLQRSEMLFARTVTHAAVGIALARPDGQLIELNQRFCDIVGQPRERLLQHNIRDFVHPQDVESGTQMLRRVVGGQADALNLEIRFVHPDGHAVWTQVGASVLANEQGRPETLVAVLTDIDAGKRAQRELEALQRSLEQRIAERTAELNAVVRQLREEKERFEDTLRTVSDAFVEVDADERIVTWNRAAEQIFGWPREEALGRKLSETIVPPAMRARHQRGFDRFMAGEPGSGELMGHRMELTGLRRDGREFPLELTLGSTHNDGHLRVNAFLHDIGRRKADELAVKETAAQLKTITDNAPAMIAFVGRDLRYRFHNRAYTDWFGVATDSLVGTEIRAFWGEQTFASLKPALDRVLAGYDTTIEYQLPSLNGPMWFYATLVPHVEDNGQITGFYLLAQDVTERKQLYERIEHEALHDALTGLPNRRALIRHLDEAMARTRRRGRPLALLFMDLDGFKHMNDTLGHDFGDAVLHRFAEILRAAVRETDFVARLAGDEFVILLEDLDPDEDRAQRAGAVVLDRLAADQEIQGVAVRLSTSIGVALYDGQDVETPQEVLRRADAAMYRAKAAGRRCMSH